MDSQARILEWVAIPFSRESSRPRDWTQVSCITADSLPSEPQVRCQIQLSLGTDFPSREEASFNFMAAVTICSDFGAQKRHLPLGRKVMANLDSIFKSRDVILPTKVCLVKAIVFPVVMYGCESWTVKKAEHQRIDAFELWCWRRLLRVPWTARKSILSL